MLSPQYIEEFKTEFRAQAQPDRLPKLLVPALLTAAAFWVVSEVL